MKDLRMLVWTAAAMLLVACAGTPPQPGRAPRSPTMPPSAKPSPLPVKPAPSAARPAPPAVLALAQEAQKLEREGRPVEALSALERALRIQPRSAPLWYEAARLQLVLGRPREAESFAQKSNILSAGDRRLVARNWTLIERARRARGDLAGARQAATQAERATQGR